MKQVTGAELIGFIYDGPIVVTAYRITVGSKRTGRYVFTQINVKEKDGRWEMYRFCYVSMLVHLVRRSLRPAMK